MPNVLLITDSPRIKKIFDAVDATGILQLRTASTLALADQEIAEDAPSVIFIQSRLSGVSPELILHHLKKILPASAKVVLLSADSEELEKAHRQDLPGVDLALSDEAVTAAIHDALSGVFSLPVSKPAEVQPEPVSKGQEKPEKAEPEEPVAERISLTGVAAKASSDDFEVLPHPATPETPQPEPEAPRVDFQELLKGKEETTAAYELPGHSGDFTYGKTVAEALRSAEQEKGRNLLVPLSIGAVVLVSLGFLVLGKGKKKEPANLVPQASQSVAPHGDKTKAAAPPAAHPTQKPAAPPQTAASQKPVPHPATAPAGPKPAPSAVASSALQPSPAPAPAKAPPAVKTPAAPQPAPAQKQAPAAPVAKQTQPERRHVMKSLPAVIAAAKLDPSYAKTHPGWQRYVGTSADFKVFRDSAGIKAVQVFAKGDAVPNPVLSSVLREFAGTDSFEVKSRGEQENYLVERGEAKGGVGVTVYRKKGDRRVKGLVLYYR